jgi:nicotinate phosphoribosyltransferase
MLNSLIDNDLYKFTMQQAVLQMYPHATASYKFINRRPGKLVPGMVKDIFGAIQNMESLQIKPHEVEFLKERCPFLKPWYIEYLKGYRFDPREVSINWDDAAKDINITISGPWHRTILWEVPLLAIVSEIYYNHCSTIAVDDQEYYTHTLKKGRALADAEAIYFEFGTRRRRNYNTQDTAIDALLHSKNEKGNNYLFGVSNIHFAHLYNAKPVGTMAHEWIMAHSALSGLRHANQNPPKMVLFHKLNVIGVSLSS